MIKKIRKIIVDFLWINVYNINWVRWYNRVYESKTMDFIEYVYWKIKSAYAFIVKIVYSIALYSSTIFFMLVPSWWQVAPLERAKLLVTGIRRERNSLLEEYQAQFQEIYDEAADASVINAELMAMNDEQRVAYFKQQDEDIRIMYELQDKERDDFMNRYDVPYGNFKILFKRTWYYDNYRVSQVASKTEDWFTTYTILFIKGKDNSTLLTDIIKELQDEHKEVVSKIDEKLALPIPKLEFAITEYIEYKGIPDRKKERVRDLDRDYSHLAELANMFKLAQEEQKAKKDEEIKEIVDKYSKKD